MNASLPFFQVFAKHKDQIAVVEPGGRSVTYGGLLSQTVGLALHLAELGLVAGDRVVLQVPNGIEFSAAAMAVLLSGGVPVLIEPGLGDEVYLARVQASKASWQLVHPVVSRVNAVPGGTAVLRRFELDLPPPLPASLVANRLALTPKLMRRVAADVPFDVALRFAPASRHGSDDGILVFTGGTTSDPKGVRLTHQALAAYIKQIGAAVSDLTVENYLADTPQQVLYALRLGKTAYVSKGRKARRARYVHKLLTKGLVGAYFGSPYVWSEMMARSGSAGLQAPALASVMLGGAPVTREFLGRLIAWLPETTKVVVLYGLTEAGPVCAVEATRKLNYRGDGDLVGSPVGDVTLEIPDATHADGIAEVVVHSPSLYAGYVGKPARGEDEGLRTGDLGKLVQVDGEKMLVLHGRVKDMIIRNGVNIYPLSFEERLRALEDAEDRPLLRECALVGLWNDVRQDEDVVLCVEPAAGVELDEGMLRRKAHIICGTDAMPDHVLLLSSIPVTGRQNKVDKKQLRELCKAELQASISDLSGDRAEDDLWRRLPGAVAPFNWGAFWSKHKLLYKEMGGFRAAAGPMAFRLGLHAVSQTGWALDEVVQRGWKKAEFRGPLFILGHQRSGTTFLHRLLSADQTNVRSLLFHEMLLPAASLQRSIGGVARLDSKLGGWVAGRVRNWQERKFGPMDPIHRIRFDEVEEDEFVLWSIYASGMCANDSPFSTANEMLDDLRSFHDWDEQRQASALGYYRACLMKKVHREPGVGGVVPWVVSKNPAFGQKLRELAKVFPDARFVYLVRNPLVAIPSRLSLIKEIWRQRFPGFDQMSADQVSTIYADSCRTYLFAHRDLAAMPEERKLIMGYEQFVADPADAVHAIYRQFALPAPDQSLLAALDEASRKQRTRQSHHRYDLSEFGLDRSTLESDLADVLEAHGFATGKIS